MPLIAGFRDYMCKVGTQRLDVRLHAGTGAAFRPQQSFGKLRRACALPLGPYDERLPQGVFPLSQRTPQIAVGAAERLCRMTNRACIEDGVQYFEQRIVNARPALLAWFERVAQMQAERGPDRVNFGLRGAP